MMRKILLTLFLNTLVFLGHAQEKVLPNHINFSYYGNIINEQGVRISTQFYGKDLNFNEENKKEKCKKR